MPFYYLLKNTIIVQLSSRTAEVVAAMLIPTRCSIIILFVYSNSSIQTFLVSRGRDLVGILDSLSSTSRTTNTHDKVYSTSLLLE